MHARIKLERIRTRKKCPPGVELYIFSLVILLQNLSVLLYSYLRTIYPPLYLHRSWTHLTILHLRALQHNADCQKRQPNMQSTNIQSLLNAASYLNPREWLSLLDVAAVKENIHQLQNSPAVAFVNLDRLSLPPLGHDRLQKRVLGNLLRFYRFYAAILGVIILNAILTNWIFLATIVVGYKGTRYLLRVDGQDVDASGRQVGSTIISGSLLVTTLVLAWWASPLSMIIWSLVKAAFFVLLHVVFMGSDPIPQAVGDRAALLVPAPILQEAGDGSEFLGPAPFLYGDATEYAPYAGFLETRQQILPLPGMVDRGANATQRPLYAPEANQFQPTKPYGWSGHHDPRSPWYET